MDVSEESRAIGCLLGLACGDAVGTTVEFSRRGSFEPVTDMVGGGPFGLEPGQWTDDTTMALCLGESLIECGEFDPADQLNRYLRFYRHGYMSPTGRCFDIGRTTEHALRRFEKTREPDSGATDRMSAGNGSIMRLAPVVLFAHPDSAEVAKLSEESSKTTHASAEAVAACRILGTMLSALISGATRDAALTCVRPDARMSDRLISVVRGEWREKPIEAISGSGYVVHSLEAALWCFAHTDDFEAAVLAATNLGDDADTTAAVCGQLAGAFHGLDGIPPHWRKRVFDGARIEAMARALFHA